MKQNMSEVSWKVGGQQGEGIESSGEILSTALNRLGYYLYGYRHFSSRIKGGHTNYNVRISLTSKGTIANELDILIAFDQETIDINRHELQSQGIILADEEFNPTIKNIIGLEVFPVPFSKIAASYGSMIMKNIVALGATAALLGIDLMAFTSVIQENFAKKNKEVIDHNLGAFHAGAQFIHENGIHLIEKYVLPKVQPVKRMFMMGNEAIALGAIAAGSRFMAAYPITPASEIMEYMIKKPPALGGDVIQTEDEIAACTMAIGANYAGARAFTATSGPGLSLMAEAIGLAGMAEIPLVVVNTQRGGPSTGLPTKNEQSDVMAAIYHTHGDTPKVVLTPSTVEEAFYDTIEAFNIAEEYQCPVIILTDLQLSLGKQTVELFQYEKIKIRRGNLMQESILPTLAQGEYFKRFQVTKNGISPRVLPGMPNGIHLITGLEHDEMGKPAEAAANRIRQTDKRIRKLTHLVDHYPRPIYINAPYEEADLLIIGMTGSRGAIEETMTKLTAENWKVNHAHIRLLHPFPIEQLNPLYTSARKVLVVEHNAIGQLAALIRMNRVDDGKMINLLKYDGGIFNLTSLYEKCKEVL
ncbi:2-oxoacid:acceptor oxidoreductase subunit alpha [Pelosinus sp. sgz500959]|uniref:2-oxoacid:acceptor oxidoreductase subunit alpha n=1 Tax=Pelosinus sp. sgz500959 TaxID=3242472 RepID=UPI00366EEAA0